MTSQWTSRIKKLIEGCENTPETFSRVLNEIIEQAELIEKRPIPPKEVARRLNYGYAMINRWLGAKMLPPKNSIGKIAKALEEKMNCSKEYKARLMRAWTCEFIKQVYADADLGDLEL